jgi:hypothetical protein
MLVEKSCLRKLCQIQPGREIPSRFIIQIHYMYMYALDMESKNMQNAPKYRDQQFYIIYCKGLGLLWRILQNKFLFSYKSSLNSCVLLLYTGWMMLNDSEDLFSKQSWFLGRWCMLECIS